MITKLKGLSVLNTRPRDEARALTQQIQQAGGVVTSLPAINIKCPTTPPRLPDLSSIDYAIFISPHAVSYFFKTFSTAQWPSSITFLVLGEGTQKKLIAHHLMAPIIVPKEANSEAFLALDCLHHVRGKKILLIKGEGGRTLIQETLNQRGALVFPVNVYRRTCPKLNPTRINRLWKENTIDIILMTSYDAMINLMTLFDSNQSWLLNKPWIVFSERLASLARQRGAAHVIVSRTDEIIQTLTYIKEPGPWNRMQRVQQKKAPPNNHSLT